MYKLIQIVFTALYNADTFRGPLNRQQRKDFEHGKLMFLI